MNEILLCYNVKMPEANESAPKPGKESKIDSTVKKAWSFVIKHKPDQTPDLTSIPILGPKIVEFDNQIPIKGLPLVVKESFEKYGVRISAEFSQSTTEEVLTKNPVLLVATHPQIIDVAAVLGALPAARRDVFLLGNSLYLGSGENARAHLIPIYGVANQTTRNLRSRLWRSTGFEPSPPPLMQSARLNLASLRVASQKIKQGGLVVIFPDGSKEAGGKWFNGVGELVKNMKENNNARIVFASVSGSRSRDKFRFLPKAANLLGEAEIRVRFSEPHLISEYLADSRESITQRLRDQYDLFSR